MRTNVKILALTVTLLLIGTSANAQLRFSEEEQFTFSIYVDPVASFKTRGLDIGADIEYKGVIYAKAGIESFSALPGGYFEIHGGVGPRMTLGRYEDISIYAGIKMGVVIRNEAPNAIFGFESGVDYTFPNGLLVGINGSYIYQGDMKAIQQPEIWREKACIKIGYSWN